MSIYTFFRTSEFGYHSCILRGRHKAATAFQTAAEGARLVPQYARRLALLGEASGPRQVKPATYPSFTASALSTHRFRDFFMDQHGDIVYTELSSDHHVFVSDMRQILSGCCQICSGCSAPNCLVQFSPILH